MLTPLLLWGVLNILANGIGYAMVDAMRAPVATFTKANYVLALHKVNSFYTVRLVKENTIQVGPPSRAPAPCLAMRIETPCDARSDMLPSCPSLLLQTVPPLRALVALRSRVMRTEYDKMVYGGLVRAPAPSCKRPEL